MPRPADPAPRVTDPTLTPFLSHLADAGPRRDLLADCIERCIDKWADIDPAMPRAIVRSIVVRRAEFLLAAHHGIPYAPLEGPGA